MWYPRDSCLILFALDTSGFVAENRHQKKQKVLSISSAFNLFMVVLLVIYVSVINPILYPWLVSRLMAWICWFYGKSQVVPRNFHHEATSFELECLFGGFLMARGTLFARWMAYFMEKSNLKLGWFSWGYPHDLGNRHWSLFNTQLPLKVLERNVPNAPSDFSMFTLMLAKFANDVDFGPFPIVTTIYDLQTHFQTHQSLCHPYKYWLVKNGCNNVHAHDGSVCMVYIC